ncbi:MAG: ABC transporter permease [Lachnospiraceae bacterium]|nr:ABC transporter permease [Lachnospiraceae bacterium]
MKYVGKKILTMCLTLLLVSFLVFLCFTVIPGDPALAKLGTEATPERVEALRKEMGLDRPFMVRYGDWLISFIQGDMGKSYSYSLPVKQMLADKVPITVTMSVMSILIIIFVSIPLGLYVAKREGGVADRVIYAVNQVIMAVPPFFAGILITLLFGIVLKLFMPGGYVSYTQSITGFLGYMIFPSIAIALPKISMTVKLLRSGLVGEKKKDYVRTAYSRGNNTKGVLYKHILKNAMLPVVTFLGMTFTDIIAGSIIVEQVFSIPGIGRILMTSISNRDYPVVMAVIVSLAATVIVINGLVDLIYQWIDPRIRLEEQS